MVELETENLRVGGSSPSAATMKLGRGARKRLRKGAEEEKSKKKAAREAAQEKQEKQETAIREALRKSRGCHKQLLREYFPVTIEGGRLARVFRLRRPKILFLPVVAKALDRIAGLPWVRRPEDWNTRGSRGANSALSSLCRHLIARYPVPRFLERAFLFSQEDHNSVNEVYRRAAVGGSLYELVRTRGLPLEDMTRRTCHVFLQAPCHMGFFEAARWAQAVVMGAEKVPAVLALVRYPRLGSSPFWTTVLQWLAKHPMMNSGVVPHLVDYLQHRRNETPDFSMSGRSPAALLEGMERWHRQLQKMEKAAGGVYKPSGYGPGIWEVGNFDWEITEVLTGKGLAQEGRVMKHCVYSYGNKIESGHISIWSLRRAARPKYPGEFQVWERALTVEVRNRTNCLGQISGARNRKASQREMEVVRRWCVENNIRS